MNPQEEIQEAVESVGWWLDAANSQARRELSERRPEMEAWLNMIQKKVEERLGQVEQEGLKA